MITDKEVNEAAQKVIPADMLESFMSLPIESKLAGLAIIAQLAGRSDLAEVTLKEYRKVNLIATFQTSKPLSMTYNNGKLIETRLSPQGKFLVSTLANHVTPIDCREFTSRDTADNYVMEEMSKANLATAVFTAAW